MRKKTPKEQHNFALSAALFLGAMVMFFVVSSWYLRFTNMSESYSIFNTAEYFITKQKTVFSDFSERLNPGGVSLDAITESFTNTKVVENNATSTVGEQR